MHDRILEALSRGAKNYAQLNSHFGGYDWILPMGDLIRDGKVVQVFKAGDKEAIYKRTNGGHPIANNSEVH